MDDNKTQLQTQPTPGYLIRHHRIEKGIDTERLGGPEFSMGYVEAMERGRVVPSRRATEILARRLDMQPEELAGLFPRGRIKADLAAITEDLDFQLNYAKMLQRDSKFEESLELLNEIEGWVRPYRKRIPGSVFYRIPFLRGRAYSQLIDLHKAQTELEGALRLASEDALSAITVRNLLGYVLYELEQPNIALQHHLQCLRAIQNGVVKDLNLRISIYRNLANDYWGVNDVQAAIATYTQALSALEDLDDPERKAGIYWGLSMAYQADGDLAYAKLNAKYALDIYETLGKRIEWSMMCINLAEMLSKDKQYAEAQEALEQARPILEEADDKLLLGALYKTYADLENRRGNYDKAAEYIDKSLNYTGELCRRAEESGESTLMLNRSHAEGLWTAALIGEHRNNKDVADSYFAQALDWIRKTGYTETETNIAYSYADVLKKRGDFERAIEFFETALQAKTRPRHRH